MNKYALTLPLMIISFVLGYYGSSSQMDNVIIIAISSTIFVVVIFLAIYLVARGRKRNRKIDK